MHVYCLTGRSSTPRTNCCATTGAGPEGNGSASDQVLEAFRPQFYEVERCARRAGAGRVSRPAVLSIAIE